MARDSLGMGGTLVRACPARAGWMRAHGGNHRRDPGGTAPRRSIDLPAARRYRQGAWQCIAQEAALDTKTLIIVVLVIACGGLGYYVYDSQQNRNTVSIQVGNSTLKIKAD